MISLSLKFGVDGLRCRPFLISIQMIHGQHESKKNEHIKGFVRDIEGLAFRNGEFRRVLYMAKHFQVVVTALKPKKEIESGRPQLNQFFRVEEGLKKVEVEIAALLGEVTQ